MFWCRCGPGVSLALWCFVVYSTRRFVVCLILCYFVLVFFSPFSIAITSLGEERANLSVFRTFDPFVLVWICRFPLGVWEGLRFVIVALPGLFSKHFLRTNTMLLDALSAETTTNYSWISTNSAATSGSSNTDSCRRDMDLLNTETRLFTKDITDLTHSD